MTTTKTTNSTKKEALKEASKELIDLFVKLMDADCPGEAKDILEALQNILDALDYL